MPCQKHLQSRAPQPPRRRSSPRQSSSKRLAFGHVSNQAHNRVAIGKQNDNDVLGNKASSTGDENSGSHVRRDLSTEKRWIRQSPTLPNLFRMVQLVHGGMFGVQEVTIESLVLKLLQTGLPSVVDRFPVPQMKFCGALQAWFHEPVSV